MAFSVAEMESQRFERAVERDELIEHDHFVRALIRRFIADPHLADELTQETWLAALRQSAASCFLQRAWLGTVARNLAFQAMRGNARRIAREPATARSLAVEPDDEVHIDADLRQRVLAAVEALHEPYRTVVRLRSYDDLAPTEIAARLRAPHRRCARSSSADCRLCTRTCALRGENGQHLVEFSVAQATDRIPIPSWNDEHELSGLAL